VPFSNLIVRHLRRRPPSRPAILAAVAPLWRQLLGVLVLVVLVLHYLLPRHPLRQPARTVRVICFLFRPLILLLSPFPRRDGYQIFSEIGRT